MHFIRINTYIHDIRASYALLSPAQTTTILYIYLYNKIGLMVWYYDRDEAYYTLYSYVHVNTLWRWKKKTPTTKTNEPSKNSFTFKNIRARLLLIKNFILVVRLQTFQCVYRVILNFFLYLCMLHEEEANTNSKDWMKRDFSVCDALTPIWMVCMVLMMVDHDYDDTEAAQQKKKLKKHRAATRCWE